MKYTKNIIMLLIMIILLSGCGSNTNKEEDPVVEDPVNKIVCTYEVEEYTEIHTITYEENLILTEEIKEIYRFDKFEDVSEIESVDYKAMKFAEQQNAKNGITATYESSEILGTLIVLYDYDVTSIEDLGFSQEQYDLNRDYQYALEYFADYEFVCE